MTTEALRYGTDGPIARITLNRPDVANAMNPAFWQEMVDVFAAIADDTAIRAVVIDGAGKHFTAGMDLAVFGGLAEAGPAPPSRQRERLRRTILELQESFNVIERCRAPVLAAIHGACIGGGVDLISACDIRYCTEVVQTNLLMSHYQTSVILVLH